MTRSDRDGHHILFQNLKLKVTESPRIGSLLYLIVILGF